MTLDLNNFNQAIERAFRKTVDYLRSEMTRQIETVKWQWDGTITVRRSGEVVGSPRNIVDLGNLRDSLNVSFLNSSLAEFIYETVYAELVHEGYTTSTGKSKPARPWVIEAVDEANLLRFFADRLKEELSL